eukprot:4556223-Amphidinium_carterae.2
MRLISDKRLLAEDLASAVTVWVCKRETWGRLCVDGSSAAQDRLHFLQPQAEAHAADRCSPPDLGVTNFVSYNPMNLQSQENYLRSLVAK